MNKKPYNENYLCPRHNEVAAVCERCYVLALGQRKRQCAAEQEREHEQYLARLGRAATTS